MRLIVLISVHYAPYSLTLKRRALTIKCLGRISQYFVSILSTMRLLLMFTVSISSVYLIASVIPAAL